MHYVYRIAWDGEISMSGEPHVASVGHEFRDFEDAHTALLRLPRVSDKPNIHIERREVTDWKSVWP